MSAPTSASNPFIMKKFINKPENIVRELIDGLVKSHPDLLQLVGNDLVVRRKPKAKGKVWIVFGQGIGHEPAYDAMVGHGMHDVEVPGGIFSCAGGDRIYEGIKLAWEKSGKTPVLQLIANHEGDVINGTMAYEMARDEGIDVEKVLLYDDIASAPKGQEEKRRGMGGMTFSFKVAGAMAEQGQKRDDIIKTVKAVNAGTRTLSVALRACTVPTTGQLLFHLAEDEFIIGPGVHGEPGPEGPLKMMSANEIMDRVADRVIEDGGFKSGDEVLAYINGTGGTTLMEMYILYDRLDAILKKRNIKAHRPLIANIITTQEMAGFSLSLCKADAAIKKLWDAPANTPCFKCLGDLV